MELDHLRQNIQDELSSHETVGLELESRTIEAMIREGVNKVAPWYEERVVESVDCQTGAATSTNLSDTTIYVDESDLSYAVDHVISIWAAKLETTGLTSLTRQILGIELLQLNLGDVEEQAQWEMLIPMLRKLWDQDLRHIREGGNIYIHGRVPDNRVTVEYARTVEKVEDMVDRKALNWVKDWATAKSKQILGRMRSKYRAGGLNFETDGTDLVQEANEEIRQLREDLKTLQFNYCVTR